METSGKLGPELSVTVVVKRAIFGPNCMWCKMSQVPKHFMTLYNALDVPVLLYGHQSEAPTLHM